VDESMLWSDFDGSNLGWGECQMSKLKVQMKSEAQMKKLIKKGRALTLSYLSIHLTFGL
jgi:hypothetical protein